MNCEGDRPSISSYWGRSPGPFNSIIERETASLSGTARSVIAQCTIVNEQLYSTKYGNLPLQLRLSQHRQNDKPASISSFTRSSRISEDCLRHKVPFTSEDDALLMKFIATYNPHTRGRLGKKLYERLVANVCIALPPCDTVQLTFASGRREMVFRLPPPIPIMA
jgi:hypothetical protein